MPRKSRSIHYQVVKHGFEEAIFVGNTLVDLYAKCGSIEDAWHVFEKLPHRDVVSWNAMILVCAEMGEGEIALKLYVLMHQEGLQASDRTFVGALKASLAEVEEGKQGAWREAEVFMAK